MTSIRTVLLIISFCLSVTIAQVGLSLERVDAIADLCGIATKYFADSPYETFESPEVIMMNSFAWEISEMWDKNESSLYVLTRLATLVEERDENGKLSSTARIIRTYAQQSDARTVFTTTIEEDYDDNEDDSTSGLFFGQRGVKQGADDEIEKLYQRGRKNEADAKLAKMIQTRWTKMQQAIKDIEISGKKGNFNVLSGLIKIGSSHRTLKYIAPELKAGIGAKFLALDKLELDQISSKWLLTMDTYREDQLKLVKLIEKHMKINGQFSTNFLQTRKNNDLVQLIGEVVGVARSSGKEEFSKNYFKDVELVDENKLAALAEELYKKVEIKEKAEAEAEIAGLQKVAIKIFEMDKSVAKEEVKEVAKVTEITDRKTVASKIPDTQTAETVQIKSVIETAEPVQAVAVETKAFIETPKAIAVEEATQKAVAVETPKSLIETPKATVVDEVPKAEDDTYTPNNVTPIIRNNVTPIIPQQEVNNNANNQTETVHSKDNYFEEREKNEEEIDQLIYENNSDPLYDNDGVYDEEEQKRDRAAWLVVAILMGLIVGTAVGSYVYLRVRRARRNRTMLVVNGALAGAAQMPVTA